MVVRDRSFSRGTAVCDYWLSRCEGFVVRTGGRTVGVVETVAASDPLGRAEELLVRRRRGRLVVPAEQVLAVVPGRRELLARRRPGRLRPRVRATYAVAKPLVVAAALLTLALALRLGRVLAALARATGDEVLDYKRKLDLRREASRPHVQQGVAELARRLRQLEQLPRRLPPRSEARRPAVDAPPAANAYVFALRHDRLDDQS